MPVKLQQNLIFRLRIHTYSQIDKNLFYWSLPKAEWIRKIPSLDLPEDERKFLFSECIGYYLYQLVCLYDEFPFIENYEILNMVHIPGVKESFLLRCRRSFKSCSVDTFQMTMLETNSLCCFICYSLLKYQPPLRPILQTQEYSSDTFDCLFHDLFVKKHFSRCSMCEFYVACAVCKKYKSPLHDIKFETLRKANFSKKDFS